MAQGRDDRWTRRVTGWELTCKEAQGEDRSLDAMTKLGSLLRAYNATRREKR